MTNKLTRSEMEVLARSRPDEAPDVEYPSLHSDNADWYTFLQKTLQAAAGVPQVDDPDYSPAYVYNEDFRQFIAAEWDVVTTSGSGNVSIADAKDGILEMTTEASASDVCNIQPANANETFKLASGKPVWFETRLKIDDVDQTAWVVGLFAGDNDDPTNSHGNDCIFFTHPEGENDGKIDIVSDQDGTSESVADIKTMSDGTWVRFGFYYDGSGTLTPYVDGVAQTAISTTICTDEELMLTIGMEQEDATADTLSVDYVKIAQARG